MWVITRTTPIGSSVDIARPVAVQPDGKIVAAGYSASSSGDDSDFALVRYNPDGSLDTASFGGGDGKVADSFLSLDDFAYDVAIQPDGKIAGAANSGSVSTANYDFALGRYTVGGDPDTTFSGDGRVTTPVSSGNRNDQINSLALQSDGKIVVAGESHVSGNADFALARYLGYDASDTAPVTFTVNSISDAGTGGCTATKCMLREAITAANADPGMDKTSCSGSREHGRRARRPGQRYRWRGRRPDGGRG